MLIAIDLSMESHPVFTKLKTDSKWTLLCHFVLYTEIHKINKVFVFESQSGIFKVRY
jgi:hypothetical protein